jgi:hypothetical protein
LYSKFSSNVSSFLKQEGVHWSEFGSTYPQAISYLWSSAKETYDTEEGLRFAVENIEDSFGSISSDYDIISERFEDLDSVGGLNWWEMNEINSVRFKGNDNVEFYIDNDYREKYFDNKDFNLTKSSDVNELMDYLSRLITSRNTNADERKALKKVGVPSSSDIFIHVTSEYDEDSDTLNAVVTLPDLPKYLDYEYLGIVPSSTDDVDGKEEVKTVKKEEIKKEVGDADIELERMRLETEQLKSKENILKMAKELGLEGDPLKKFLGI